MINPSALLGLVTAVAMSSVVPAYAQDLTSEMTYKVVMQADDGSELLIDRNAVRPGEIIEYQIAHHNGTDADISGLAIALPVPEGVTISLGKEASSLPANFEVQAEMDPEAPGLEWSTLPAMRTVIDPDGTARSEPVPAEDIEGVRWILEAAIPSGETAINAYRVVVN